MIKPAADARYEFVVYWDAAHSGWRLAVTNPNTSLLQVEVADSQTAGLCHPQPGAGKRPDNDVLFSRPHVCDQNVIFSAREDVEGFAYTLRRVDVSHAVRRSG